jgi:hypothetical protein
MNRIEESAPESMMLMLHLAVEAVAPVSKESMMCISQTRMTSKL